MGNARPVSAAALTGGDPRIASLVGAASVIHECWYGYDFSAEEGDDHESGLVCSSV
jgi:hypothetical protein